MDICTIAMGLLVLLLCIDNIVVRLSIILSRMISIILRSIGEQIYVQYIPRYFRGAEFRVDNLGTGATSPLLDFDL